jgi:hypothetical protein
MRLISQNGRIDIPYENSVINVHSVYGYNKEKKHHDITGYRIIIPIGDDTWVLGEYSTEEKALCVMKMLQQAYLGRNEALNLEMPEETTEEMENIMLKQGYGTLHVISEERKPRVDYYPLHTYFKFPPDESVNEVSA